MSYDAKCRELADHFLSDYPETETSKEDGETLAQEIQDAIEWWLDWRFPTP